jgi:hypothetical protein
MNAPEVRRDRCLRRYATRFARFCLLRHRCPSDHPVLSTEVQLVDMARSKLQEELLSGLSVDGLARMRADLEFEIRQTARDWVLAQPVDGSVIAAVLEAVDREDLGRLFLLDN